MTSFGRAEKREVSGAHDEYAKLLCTVPGCGARWSVKIEKPLCSKHAWPETSNRLQSPLDAINPFDTCGGTIVKGDPKAWAKRIVWMNKSGMSVRPLSLKFANKALKIKSEAA
jgi:hypothetical protein